MTTFYNKNFQANLVQMPFTASKDKEYGDCYFDISKSEKRLIRATLKTYENTGTYVFLKLFKRKDNEYEFEQRISLTTEEFDKLMKKSGRIRNSVPESEGKKDTSVAKKPVAKKPKLAEKDSGYESASSSSAASTD